MNIIQSLYGINGKLSPANKELLNALLANPTLPLWHRARNIIISDQPIVTLNAAVRAVTQGRVAITKLPDTFTLYRALKYGADKRKRFFHRMEVGDTES